MKVGQYVKHTKSNATGTITAIELLDEVYIFDVTLDGDDLPTEFLVHELVTAKRPKQQKDGGGFINEFGVVLDTKKVGLGYRTSHFKPVPEAGIFTQEDLDELAARYGASRKEFNRGDREKVSRFSGPRETLGNTARYHRVPGSSTTYGGRRE